MRSREIEVVSVGWRVHEANLIANAAYALSEKIYRETYQPLMGTGMFPYEQSQAWKEHPQANALFARVKIGTKLFAYDDFVARIAVDSANNAWLQRYNVTSSEFRSDKVTITQNVDIHDLDPELTAPTVVGDLILVWNFGRGIAIDIEKRIARPMATKNAPCKRSLETIVTTDTGLFALGAEPFSGDSCVLSASARKEGRFYFAGTKEKNYVDEEWISMSALGSPDLGVLFPTAVWTGSEGPAADRLIFWGGARQDGTVRPGGIYDFKQKIWTPMNMAGAPTAVSGLHSVWSGSEMLMFTGGANVGGIYDPIKNSWRHLPPVMGKHWTPKAAEWTGDKLLVWGESLRLPEFPLQGALFDPKTNQWTALKPFLQFSEGDCKGFDDSQMWFWHDIQTAWVANQFFVLLPLTGFHAPTGEVCTRSLVP